MCFSGYTVSILGSLVACAIVSASPAMGDARAPWVPDLGNGRYRNPVLAADYSDPDVTRVGDDFYLIASSFTNIPGLPILHSKDLVNWTLIGHALPRLTPDAHFSVPRRGGGVWAPARRRTSALQSATRISITSASWPPNKTAAHRKDGPSRWAAQNINAG